MSDAGFVVTGLFEDRHGFACRRRLTVRHMSAKSPDSPDALVIMMNPGASYPLPGSKPDAEGVVSTKPDATQYRIMALMERRQWKHVTIINLSDLRDGDSGGFRRAMREYEEQVGDRSHSIFSEARRDELSSLLASHAGAARVAAWGCHDDLASLANDALERLGRTTVIGRQGKNGGWRYWHPMPHRKSWQDEWLDALSTTTIALT